MQIARRRNPSCIVEPEKTKSFRVISLLTWTPGDTQPETPYSVVATSNLQENSKRNFHDSMEPLYRDAKIDTKIDAKSVLGAARGTQNRLKIGPGRLSGRPVAPKDVPKSILGRPRHVPGAPGQSPRALDDAKMSARESPEACRGAQNRGRAVLGRQKDTLFMRGSLAKRRRSDFAPILVDFRFRCQVCKP